MPYDRIKIIIKEAIDTAELKLVSPLLDGMSVVECLNNVNGFACYLLQRETTGEKFVLKHISVPESETNVEALILTGAVSDREGARTYYRSVAQAQAVEVRNWQKLSGHDNLSVFTGFQLEEREGEQIGYDFYLLAPYRTSLHAYMQQNVITHLQALNLGIDLCNALMRLRQAGYLHEDLKPENIFLDDNGQFSIGDLGIVPLESLSFAALPEHYSNCYSAPELADITANLNPTIDIYSVGMILYHLFNGKHAPFEEVGNSLIEADQMRLQGQPLPGPLYADYELTEIINKACAFHPQDRYQTPGELRQALIVYMQKNEVSDAMIVSPLDIGEEIDITLENMEEDAALVDDTTQEEEAPLQTDDTPDMPLENGLPPEDEPVGDLAAQEPEADAAASKLEDAVEQSGSELPSAAEVAPDQTPAPETADTLPAAPALQDAEGNTEQPPESSPEDTAELDDPPAQQKDAAGKESRREKRQHRRAEKKADQSEASQILAEQPELVEVTAQSSLEEILADVNTYIDSTPETETPKAPEPALDDEDPEAILPRRKRKTKEKTPGQTPRKHVWAHVLIVVLILAVIGAAGWFGYTHWYNVVLSDLSAEAGGDYIAVSYDISVADAPLSASCKDAYGNSFQGEFNGSTVIFRGLAPGTQYYVTFQVEKPRRLSGETTINAATTDAVQVETFTATPGINSQTVNLTIVTSGQEPEQWTVDYWTESGQRGTQTFSGHSVTISDLVLNESYTFELQAPKGSSIVGQTTLTYEVLPQVQAEGMHVETLADESATIGWNSIGDPTDSWHITCTGTDYSQELDVSECTATFTGIQAGTAYTFTLSARGMETPLSITLDENSTVISSFTVTASDAGTIAVQWECTSESQPEAWLVEYTLANNPDLTTTIKTAQQESTILQAVPGTEYIVQLLASDGRTLVGSTVVTLSTPAAENFTDYDFSEEAVWLRFYPAPDTATPAFADLADSVAATDFTADASICLALQAPEDFTADAGEDEADWLITIVIRDETGTIVDYFPLSSTWSGMWTDGNYVATLPRTPDTVGIYQVELYFNNRYVAKSSLNIIQPEA